MSRIKLLLDLVQDVRAVADDLQTIADAMAGELLKQHGADRLSQIESRFYKKLLREAEVFGNAT